MTCPKTCSGLLFMVVLQVTMSQAIVVLKAQTQDQIDKAIQQLPSGERQAAEKAVKQLSPADRKALTDRIAGLSDDEKRRLAERLQQMSPKEREKLIARAETQMKGHGPKIQHVVEGPGLPPTFLLGAGHLMGTVHPPQLPENVLKLFDTAKQLIPNIVSFQRRQVDKYTERGVGNGILISHTLVLTARHVADEISANPENYDLLQIGSRDGGNLLSPLRFVSRVPVTVNDSEDPDLALVKVQGSVNPRVVMLGDGSLHVKDGVASLGCNAEEPLPAMSTGIVTTSYGSRNLAGDLPLKRTVLGASVRSYPGLSGSPVFDVNGKIVAVVLGGVKKFAGTGEMVTKISKEQNWESFPAWTWVTPLKSTLENILNAAKMDQ